MTRILRVLYASLVSHRVGVFIYEAIENQGSVLKAVMELLLL